MYLCYKCLIKLFSLTVYHYSCLALFYIQAIRFYSSNLIKIRDIKIINSPLCHLKFDNSKGIKVDNITISSPENSPNTDGIHLQNTHDVEIQHSNIGTGKACTKLI
jgi:galacturan 1,4-alpha-galacturonidase